MTPHRGGRRVSTINAQFALPEHSRAAAIAESRSRLGEHLAKKRLARLERVFAECDGRIDRGKMHHLLPADVVAHLGASGVDALFARLDADGSGAIELSEMPALMREVQALQVRMQDRCVTRRRDMTRSVARALQGGTFKLERARVRRRRSSAVHQLIATQALQAAAHAAALRSSATESHLVLVRKRSARLLKAFARADLTGDGRLSTSELAHLLPKRVSRHLGEAGTAALIERHDCDRSGTIEVAELGALLREVKVLQARLAGEFSIMYRYMLRESCSQFDSLPLTYLMSSRCSRSGGRREYGGGGGEPRAPRGESGGARGGRGARARRCAHGAAHVARSAACA
jgi:Ca2+-binding EF-hand superfamily protein